MIKYKHLQQKLEMVLEQLNELDATYLTGGIKRDDYTEARFKLMKDFKQLKKEVEGK